MLLLKVRPILSCLFFLALAASAGISQITLSTGNGDFPVGISTSWVVPANVFSISVMAQGAGGGDANDGVAPNNSGGFGAIVSTSFPVMPGDMLNIIVGVRGQDGQSGAGDGGGGGGTGIYNVTTGTTLIVAGGGGGGHGNSTTAGEPTLAGQSGIAAQGALGNGGLNGAGAGAAGGGGANGAGAGGASGSTGGGQGLISGGIGGLQGTPMPNGGNGGFGFGGGGGSVNAAGGGGGGATGGDGGYLAGGVNGKGGQSYFDASATEVTVFGTAADNVNGAVTITFEPIAVPTIGQWGIIILGLIMFAVGISVIRERKSILAFVKG